MRKRALAAALAIGMAVLLLTPLTAWAPPVLYVETWQEYTYTSGGTTYWMMDGQVRNNDTVNYTDLRVTLTWRDASDAQMGSPVTFPVPYHVLLASDLASFTWPIAEPPGWDHFDFTVTGTPTTSSFIVLAPAPDASFTDADGLRHYPLTVQNDQPFAVTALLAAGYESEGATKLGASFHNGMTDVSKLSVVLQPGAGTTVDMVAKCAPSGTPGFNLWPYMHVEAERYLPLPVYRFYNLRTGTHFYTADPAERDTVINTLGWLYHLDGTAYSVNQGAPSNSHPLYRFYNLRTGTHFYTADQAEANHIIATMGGTYHFDGPAYNVSMSQDYSQPVWRFYNFSAGTHFYTADPSERANVQNNLYHLYRYEGPAFDLAY